MPVKWTAENDHLLLLTLLETHSIRVDGDKIVAAWPANGGEVPTARAIRERIVKIRNIAGHGSPAKATASPHKNGVRKESSPKKRGRPRQTKPQIDQDDEEIISQSFTCTPSSTMQSFASTKTETVEGTPCPSPRKKRAVKVKAEKLLREESASDVIDLDTSGDDYVPMKAEQEDDEDDYLGD